MRDKTMEAQVQEDGWLASVIGHPVHRVSLGGGTQSIDLERHLRAIDSEGKPVMHYLRLDPSAIQLVRDLGRLGFYVVDTCVTFALDSAAVKAGEPAPGIARISDFVEPEVEEVLDLAEHGFRYSRFHLDPGLARETANRVKREWIKSYTLKRRGDALLVARAEGRVAGFLAALRSTVKGQRCAVIDLVAVASAFQGKGVGRALMQAFVQRYRSDVAQLRVGTQAANIPAMRLYERAGFLMDASEFVLHRHSVRPGN